MTLPPLKVTLPSLKLVLAPPLCYAGGQAGNQWVQPGPGSLEDTSEADLYVEVQILIDTVHGHTEFLSDLILQMSSADGNVDFEKVLGMVCTM